MCILFLFQDLKLKCRIKGTLVSFENLKLRCAAFLDVRMISCDTEKKTENWNYFAYYGKSH